MGDSVLFHRYGVTPENIILYGQSIGTVPTIDLAARYECAAVILHSPLMSGLRVAFPSTRKTYCFDAFPRYVSNLQLQMNWSSTKLSILGSVVQTISSVFSSG